MVIREYYYYYQEKNIPLLLLLLLKFISVHLQAGDQGVLNPFWHSDNLLSFGKSQNLKSAGVQYGRYEGIGDPFNTLGLQKERPSWPSGRVGSGAWHHQRGA